MKTHIYSLILLITLGSQGCKKSWLEAKSDMKQAVPSTVEDFQAMLDHFTTINQASTATDMEIAADGHYYTETVWNTFKGKLTQNIYTWSDSVPYRRVSDWDNPYKTIAYTNVILNESLKAVNEDRTEIDHVRGQALFTRSFLFFQLAQEFAPPYEAEKAATQLGIPLRLTPDVEERSVRSNLQQTYQQIISDLLVAKDLLPVVPLFTTRASRIAAFGLLAKVYLVMNDYVNALKYANEYLVLKNSLLDYNTVSTTATFIGDNAEIAYTRLFVNIGKSEITSNYLISQDLLDLYKEGDVRKKVFFRTNAAGTLFKGTYGRSTTAMFSGIATDEIYLIRAECYARTGNIALAMKDLNDLVRTRYEKNSDGSSKYVNQTATSETEALKLIFLERRKQLILRNVRWSDLRRYNLDDRFKQTLTRSIGGQTYTLEPNSYKYTFPIPDDIIEITGMKQNLDW